MSPTDIPGRGNDYGAGSHKQSFLASSPLAEESLLRDLEDEEEGEGDGTNEEHGDTLGRSVSRGGDYSMVGSYRRCSAVAYGPRPLFPHPPDASRYISELDRDAALHDERSLLRDNEIIPPKHPRRESTASAKSNFLSRKMSISTFIPRRQASAPIDAEAIDDTVDEDTPLIRDATLPYGGEDTPENIDRKWDDAVASGKIQTTWQREAKTLVQYSRPLIATFALQFSLSITSVFTVGHIGKTELGAVSLGSMSANISGFAFFIGLATSLDTLCAQAYGSGHKKLVGLQLQRMVFFLWIVSIPVAVLWSFGPQVLKAVLKEQEVAEKAGQYLRVMIFGLPGYAAFESGKRYVQAQGLFNATLYVLLFVAPLNILMHWVFVWVSGFVCCDEYSDLTRHDSNLSSATLERPSPLSYPTTCYQSASSFTCGLSTVWNAGLASRSVHSRIGVLWSSSRYPVWSWSSPSSLLSNS